MNSCRSHVIQEDVLALVPAVRLGSLHHQVEMIAHQAKGMHLPPGPVASLAKRLQKAEAILVVQVNVFATVTAIHNMIDRPGILNSK